MSVSGQRAAQVPPPDARCRVAGARVCARPAHRHTRRHSALDRAADRALRVLHLPVARHTTRDNKISALAQINKITKPFRHRLSLKLTFFKLLCTTKKLFSLVYRLLRFMDLTLWRLQPYHISDRSTNVL